MLTNMKKYITGFIASIMFIALMGASYTPGLLRTVFPAKPKSTYVTTTRGDRANSTISEYSRKGYVVKTVTVLTPGRLQVETSYVLIVMELYY